MCQSARRLLARGLVSVTLLLGLTALGQVAVDAPAPPAAATGARAAGQDWPVVFQDALLEGSALPRFYHTFGQYGGRPVLEEKVGLRVYGGHTTGALWLPTPVNDAYRLELQTRFTGDGDLCVWLGGPGHGNSQALGYWLRVSSQQVELRREGREVARYAFPETLAAGDFHALVILRTGDRLAVWLDQQQVVAWRDDKPLRGALHARIGFGCAAGAANKGVCCKDLILRRPDLAPAVLAALTTVPLLPATDIHPTPNGPTLFSATAADLVSAAWFRSQPEFAHVVGTNVLLLSGPNGFPRVFQPVPVHGDFAFEVVFEYVLPDFPGRGPGYGENYVQHGGEEHNFMLSVVLQKDFPTADQMAGGRLLAPAGWEYAVPNGAGEVALAWTAGEARQAVGSDPYHAPVAGVRHTARLERKGQQVQAFLDECLIFSGEPPVPLADPAVPAYLGLQQFYGGVLIHGAAAYALK